jgi:hypothetical protein
MKRLPSGPTAEERIHGLRGALAALVIESRRMIDELARLPAEGEDSRRIMLYRAAAFGKTLGGAERDLERFR